MEDHHQRLSRSLCRHQLDLRPGNKFARGHQVVLFFARLFPEPFFLTAQAALGLFLSAIDEENRAALSSAFLLDESGDEDNNIVTPQPHDSPSLRAIYRAGEAPTTTPSPAATGTATATATRATRKYGADKYGPRRRAPSARASFVKKRQAALSRAKERKAAGLPPTPAMLRYQLAATFHDDTYLFVSCLCKCPATYAY